MRRCARTTGAWLGGLALVGAAAACLDPLEAALDCPAGAQHAYCEPLDAGTATADDAALPPPPAVSNGPEVPSVVCPLDLACLQTSGRSCTCDARSECSSAAPVCYPAGDCPPTLGQQSPAATCLPLTEQSFFFATTSGTGCTCGCSTCAAAADGVGPILGTAVLEVDLGGGLPSAGSVSFYVRWRGSGRITASFLDVQGNVLATGAEDVDTAGVFTEQVFPTDAASGRAISYSWRGTTAPALLSITPGVDTALEIDALVVYVTP
jgi:hypothetical protein